MVLIKVEWWEKWKEGHKRKEAENGFFFSILVSFELYVPVDFSDWYYWNLVCVCDSNLRKFLVEISDTVSLDRIVVNWLEFIFCVFVRF